jgi:hypothetical protein
VPIPGLDIKGISPELLPSRLNFLLLNLIFSVLLTSPSLFSYPFSYPLHFPYFSCATIHRLPLLSFPNLSPHYTSLLQTHHLLTSLLYQPYTCPDPCNPWQKHTPLQQQKYTQTHTRVTKHSNPIPLPPPSTLPFTATFNNNLREREGKLGDTGQRRQV